MKISFLLVIFIIIIISILVTLLLLDNFNLRKEMKSDVLDKNIIAISNDTTFLERKIIGKSQNPNYKIKTYYPFTSYQTLNTTVEDKIKKEIDSLKQIAMENMPSPNQYYSLNINYESYSYNSYLSYVFYISTFTGNDNSHNTIWTVTYDKNTDTFITIEFLAKKYPSLLDNIAIETRKILEKDKRFTVDNDIKDMLIDGTIPNEDNFKSFAFSENGLIIFFEQNQIAPSSLGDYEITIPYHLLF